MSVRRRRIRSEDGREAHGLLVAVTIPRTAFQVMRGQLAWFASMGYQVTLVASPGPFLDQVADREGVATVSLQMERDISPFADFRSLVRAVRYVRRINPHIVNAGTPKAGLIIGLAAAINRVPVRIYTMRGLRLETAHGLRRWLLWCMEWLTCHAAHRVVVVSPSLLERACKLRLTARSKAVVIGRGSSNGIAADRFATDGGDSDTAGETMRALTGIPSGAPVIGFVGRLSPDKGLRELLAAHKIVRRSHPDAALLIVGDIDRGAKSPIPSDRQARIAAGIFLTGRLIDPVPAFHAMDILALPTFREGFPNVSLEAAAAGKPVVTTFATGARDSVIDGVTGILVPPGESASLAGALATILAMPDRGRSMGAAGSRWVREEFTPEEIWLGLHSLYTDMLSAHQSSGWLSRSAQLYTAKGEATKCE